VETAKRFRIEQATCTGCCDCLRVCEDHAIRKFTSELCAKCVKYCGVMKAEDLQCNQNKMCIDESVCTGCGKCVEVCRSEAVSQVV
jgi:Pyruvate/2-oxoacid:ferredoxin oxidoreductase delta subunit